jgi:aryl-alcohol dehydrogenase-like predicted oxidoreductase
MTASAPGGTFDVADDLTVSRMGFGAMRLAGRGVLGPPRDRDEALAVLRTVVELGITHIDTSDYYGPHLVNELIREALSPYPPDLHIVTKVGARRTPQGAWLPALGADDLVRAVHENLEHLGLATLDVVNLRMMTPSGRPERGSLAPHLEVLARLQEEGLVRHLGVSNVTPDQVDEALRTAPVVSVQNEYNLARRGDDDLVDACADAGIAYVPFFPLGGFSPLQSSVLDRVAARLGASARQVALAWLLQRSPTILLIPGTGSVAHLRDNVAAAGLALPADAVAELDTIGYVRS